MYEIYLDKAAIKDLSKLSIEKRKHIRNQLNKCKKNPYRFFVRLTGRKDFRLRVEDQRVFADIYQHVIHVTAVKNRRNAYD